MKKLIMCLVAASILFVSSIAMSQVFKPVIIPDPLRIRGIISSETITANRIYLSPLARYLDSLLDFSAPGPIGATTPSTGNFTTLTLPGGDVQSQLNAAANGGVPLNFTLPISQSGQAVTISQATTTQDGYLSSTDFNTFNNNVSKNIISSNGDLVITDLTPTFDIAVNTGTTTGKILNFAEDNKLPVLNGSQLTNLSLSQFPSLPTTLAGYGITNAQPLDQVLTQLSGLNCADNLIPKRIAGVWNCAVDANTVSPYLYISSANANLGMSQDPSHTANGTSNTSFGVYSLNSNISGNDNVAFGRSALTGNTTGGSNVAIGNSAMFANLSGVNNVAIGSSALVSQTTGSNNIAIGTGARGNLTTGSFGVAIGVGAGSASNGSRNVFLGYKAGYNESGSDKLYIENSDSASPLIGGDFAARTVTIDGDVTADSFSGDGSGLTNLTLTGLQTRVTGTCATDYAVAEINADGTVQCSAIGGGAASFDQLEGGTSTSASFVVGTDSSITLNGGTAEASLLVSSGSSTYIVTIDSTNTQNGVLSAVTGTVAATDCSNGQILKRGASVWACAADDAGSGMAASLFNAYTILYADSDDTPAPLTVGANTVVGRLGAGITTIALDADLASVSANDDTIPSAKATKAMGDLKVPLSLFDAYSVLYADTDNTPAALTVGANTVVGRIAAGVVAVAIDADLASVSASDDTIPSAKATKAMGDLKVAKATDLSEKIVWKSPVDADDIFIGPWPTAVVLTGLYCIASGGGSIAVAVNECDNAGANCAAVGATVTADGGVDSDASLTDTAIAAGAWLQVTVGAPTGTVSYLSCGIAYHY